MSGVELARDAAQVMRQIRTANEEKARIICWEISEPDAAFNQKPSMAKPLDSEQAEQTSRAGNSRLCSTPSGG